MEGGAFVPFVVFIEGKKGYKFEDRDRILEEISLYFSTCIFGQLLMFFLWWLGIMIFLVFLPLLAR